MGLEGFRRVFLEFSLSTATVCLAALKRMIQNTSHADQTIPSLYLSKLQTFFAGPKIKRRRRNGEWLLSYSHTGLDVTPLHHKFALGKLPQTDSNTALVVAPVPSQDCIGPTHSFSNKANVKTCANLLMRSLERICQIACGFALPLRGRPCATVCLRDHVRVP